GTFGRRDDVAIERDGDPIGLRHLAPAAAFDGRALGPQVAPDVVPQVRLGLVQTGVADLAADLRPGELREFDHRGTLAVRLSFRATCPIISVRKVYASVCPPAKRALSSKRLG